MARQETPQGQASITFGGGTTSLRPLQVACRRTLQCHAGNATDARSAQAFVPSCRCATPLRRPYDARGDGFCELCLGCQLSMMAHPFTRQVLELPASVGAAQPRPACVLEPASPMDHDSCRPGIQKRRHPFKQDVPLRPHALQRLQHNVSQDNPCCRIGFHLELEL